MEVQGERDSVSTFEVTLLRIPVTPVYISLHTESKDAEYIMCHNA